MGSKPKSHIKLFIDNGDIVTISCDEDDYEDALEQIENGIVNRELFCFDDVLMEGMVRGNSLRTLDMSRVIGEIE